ncbi:hypothetical protein CRUP_027830 [Coryphaenoides rupestris]|nr:hypothetical protein CRUP_027830 [Coryphaenoides rupestris]
MSSVSAADSLCNPGDTICEIRVYEQEVIIVPILLLASFLVTLVFILLLRFCPEKVERIRPQAKQPASRQRTRRTLHGIDAPPGINVLENESIALDIASSYSTFSPPNTYSTSHLLHTVDPPPLPLITTTTQQQPQHQKHQFRPSYTPTVQPRELPRQRLPESFNLVTALPTTFSLRSDTALGPHPFLPELLGVVSLRAPLVTVVEELQNRDMLGFLWRCRQPEATDPPCEMTERRIFTMAKQVASAVEFLHGKDLLHGNLRARSVLVSREYTAKLWGLECVYTRKNKETNQKEDPGTKKWQAPELLAKRPASQSSDVYSMIKSCCQWKDQERPSLADISRKLQSSEKNTSDKVLRRPEPANIERYLQEAGYGEANNYTVF